MLKNETFLTHVHSKTAKWLKKISTSSSTASLRDSWDAMTPPDDEVLAAQTCGARGAPIVSRDLCSLIQKFKL